MNIKEAKEQIKNAMIAYFTKDEIGEYILPPERQRPVFLMGAPGIGKTAIMEQIAAEMGVGLLSYSMTHHTRQSALGLPYIVHKTYEGRDYEISEYTMSEIIASIYEMMQNTGVKEGILFLDEINCVSETLTPIMLQFLQYKVFGKHSVPRGWIVVTAGNPPEYNNSVREFDIVTWDRLKRIDVEPDFGVWKEYAYQAGIHPAILTFLEIKTADFYLVESSVDGKNFVTARGWEDLSKMIILYEKNGLIVDDKLVCQYLQEKRIARDFARYYDLFNKYRSDYSIPLILEGKSGNDILERAQKAKFDERLSLIGLLLDAVNQDMSGVMEENSVTSEVMEALKNLRLKMAKEKQIPPAANLEALIAEYDARLQAGKTASSLSAKEQHVKRRVIRVLEGMRDLISSATDSSNAFGVLKAEFDRKVRQLKTDSAVAGDHLTNMLKFAEKAFENGQELLVLVTELTANRDSALFIARFGCDEYFRHNRELLLYERQQDIRNVLGELKLEALVL